MSREFRHRHKKKKDVGAPTKIKKVLPKVTLRKVELSNPEKRYHGNTSATERKGNQFGRDGNGRSPRQLRRSRGRLASSASDNGHCV